MSRKSYPNVNAANQYARDVVRGKIVACQFVIQACQRHLDDLMAEKSKSFRYRFDKDLAERAAKFIQLLPHTKGEWAFKRMPITLEPWQLFVICCAFGWVNKGTRLRRFREVYTEIPRKNGKSAISAGVALYCFACDNEFGAEVYSGATTEKQAWEVFRPARLMCKRTPMLTEAFGIEVNASNMNRPEDGARFEPLIGNPGDGSSPHCAVVDEYHEHATDALYTTMLTGMGARRQPLMWAITTAGYNIEGPCYDKRREVIEMLNGSVPNDELFGIIYTVDEGDDWTDPQVLEKAKSMALNAEDSQFLETRKFQLEEICRLFRVPLHMVQNTDRATFNNIEELGLGFINYSLVPYLTRIEQRINTGLVRKSKQGVYYAKFNAGALLRGDMKSRFEAYATGINWGIYSPNDCRDLEDMNPRPGGDVYLTPMNMTTKPSDGSKAGKQKDNANADETTS